MWCPIQIPSFGAECGRLCAHVCALSLDDAVPSRALQGHAMGRLLRPVDIAATVGHLLSDASAMMTGTIIDLHPEMVSINWPCDSSGTFFLEA